MNDVEERQRKLFSVCESGAKSALIELVKSEGVNPSAYDMIDNEGKTALHIACRHGHIDIVRMLVEVYGCSPNSVDNTGSIPFHDACFYDQVEIVDYLIHVVSKPDEQLLAQDIKGNTAFHKANQSGSPCVVKYILYLIFTGMTPHKLCLDEFFFTPDYDGSDRLCRRRLHVSPPDSNRNYFLIENKIGDTPVAVACRHGHLAIIRMYFHYHIHFFHDKLNNSQYLLNIASQCGQFEVAYYLQSAYKSSISPDNVHHHLPSHTRAQIGREPSIHSRQHQEVHISVQKNYKRWCLINFTHTQPTTTESPFRMAVVHGNHQYALRFLRLQGYCCHFSTEFSPCHAACISDDIQMLDSCFDDKTINFGNTPLHTACEWGSKNVVKHLITKKNAMLMPVMILVKHPFI